MHFYARYSVTGQVIFSHYGNQRAKCWPFLGSILGVHGLHFNHLRQVLRVQGLYGTIFGPLGFMGVHRLVLDNSKPIIGVQELDLGHFRPLWGPEPRFELYF